MTRSVHVINPLGAALAHYETELRAVLNRIDVTVSGETFDEPSASGGSRLRWVVTQVAAMWRAGRSAADVVIVCWPVLGFLDVVMASMFLGRRGCVVVHDPRPLVRAIGYGPLSRRLARWNRRARVVAHSSAALADLDIGGIDDVMVLPHPIAPNAKSDGDAPVGPVVVLGQYKPERDVGLLVTLASELVGRELLVIGRGWPAIDGWQVDDRFLSEDEMDAWLRRAGVVLIPYRRFYQSGVAIRALEVGTPVVGPAGTSLDDLLGGVPDLLAADDAADWARAVQSALSLTPEEVRSRLVAPYEKSVRRSWERLVVAR